MYYDATILVILVVAHVSHGCFLGTVSAIMFSEGNVSICGDCAYDTPWLRYVIALSVQLPLRSDDSGYIYIHTYIGTSWYGLGTPCL